MHLGVWSASGSLQAKPGLTELKSGLSRPMKAFENCMPPKCLVDTRVYLFAEPAAARL